MKKFFVLLLALAMVFALAACGETNTNTETTEEPAAFPGDGTVTMVVPFDPGSGDTEARMFAQYVSKYLGTTIVATNISGGGGGVGTQSVINSAADGYALLLSNWCSLPADYLLRNKPDQNLSDTR